MKTIDRLRRIVERHQWEEIHDFPVDAVTAKVMVTAFDALNETNQEKCVLVLEKPNGFVRFAELSYKHVKFDGFASATSRSTTGHRRTSWNAMGASTDSYKSRP